MQKQWDILFGAGGTLSVVTLSQINQALACLAGLLTLGVLSLRLAREWNNRNDKPGNE